MTQHKDTFQIHLGGIIDLLSNHLYSSPEVYLRELLQNGIDAIQARKMLEPTHEGLLQIELIHTDDGRQQLMFEDNGVGLTEEETHQFLATIGQSSKRNLADQRNDFIGQFGIGLLSCFMVSEEIVMLTRSAKTPDAPTVQWRGHADGSYTTSVLAYGLSEPGTQVYLSQKEGTESLYDETFLRERLVHYGGLLPTPIMFTQNGLSQRINPDPAPWTKAYATHGARQQALLAFGENLFDEQFFDCIPLTLDEGEVQGVAYILLHAPRPGSKQPHRIYLKNMFLTDTANNLLPEWAFFVKCLINTNTLRPTASREGFYEDETLTQTRRALGRSFRRYLYELKRQDPDKLQRFIQLHYQAIKSLAIHDDEFYQMIIDSLPFITSQGRQEMGDIRRGKTVLNYVNTVDEFRQLAPLAATQNMMLINAGYIYDEALLKRLPNHFENLSVKRLEPTDFASTFGELSLDEREDVFELIKLADLVLQPFKCRAQVRYFEPASLPVIYLANQDVDFLRSVEQAQDTAQNHWSSILDALAESTYVPTYAQLCFNYNNPLVHKLAKMDNRHLLQMSIQMLYVQSLLMGHHPLNAQEMALLNTGLIDLLDWSIDHSTPNLQ